LPNCLLLLVAFKAHLQIKHHLIGLNCLPLNIVKFAL
jgi:hypothetical protein